MNLPQEVTILEEDLEGEYTNITNCPLARALKRAGMTMSVNARGYVYKDGVVAQYKWEDGRTFCYETLGTGKLVLDTGLGSS